MARSRYVNLIGNTLVAEVDTQGGGANEQIIGAALTLTHTHPDTKASIVVELTDGRKWEIRDIPLGTSHRDVPADLVPLLLSNISGASASLYVAGGGIPI